jgi:hypothetical protein
VRRTGERAPHWGADPAARRSVSKDAAVTTLEVERETAAGVLRSR